MIEFSPDFFKEEYRDGYLVSEIMKRTWAAQLKILDQLKAFFAEHDLTYYAEVGTLLGAVRHKGFVPWDDDIDLAMPRADYMRFLRLEDQLPDGLGIRSFYNTDSFSSYHAVVAHKAEKLEWNDERIKDSFGCPFIIFIDVFPLDFMPRDPEKFKIQKQLYYFSYKMAFDCLTIEESLFSGKLIKIGDLSGINDETVTVFKKELQQLKGYHSAIFGKELVIDPDRSLRNQLYLATDAVGQMCKEKDADTIDYAANLALRGEGNDKPRDYTWYRDVVELPYENTTIMAPKGYRENLVNQYGDDYMTPMRFASAHGYPFFREEVQVLIGGDTGDIYSIRNSEQYFLDTIRSFWNAHWLVCQYTLATDGSFSHDTQLYNPEAALGLLGSLQDNAVTFGEALEELLGEGHDTVRLLEKYCEGVYELYNLINEDADKEVLYSKVVDLSTILASDLHSIYIATHEKAAVEIPDEWKTFVRRGDGSLKKTVVYGLSATDIINNGSMSITQIRKYLDEVAASRDDMAVFAFIPKGVSDFMKRCRLSMYEDYERLIDELKNMDHIVVLDDPAQADIEKVMCLATEYYGDKCRLYDVGIMAGLIIVDQIYQPVE